MDYAGVYLKVSRAAHHLDTLKTALNAFLEGDPDTGAGLKIDRQSGYNIWKAVTYKPETVPLEWSVLIGEAIYQLRSSLDHLINGLIPKATRDSCFPISCDESSYDANAARYLPGLRDPYLALVRELQPFRQNPSAPMTTTLWNLNEWARLDRHRFLHVADVFLISGAVTSVPDGRITLDFSVPFPSTLENGAVIACGQILSDYAADPDSEVEVHMQTALELVMTRIGDMRIPEGMWAVQALGGLESFIAHTHEIVAAFERLPTA